MAARYLSRISTAVGPPAGAGRTSTSSSSGGGAPYRIDRLDVTLGWPLLPRPNENGQLDWPDLAGSVAAQLRVILSTRPGEQLEHPDFGAGLQEFLHEPNTLATRARIQSRIEEPIVRQEPRLVLDAVEQPLQAGPVGREHESTTERGRESTVDSRCQRGIHAPYPRISGLESAVPGAC